MDYQNQDSDNEYERMSGEDLQALSIKESQMTDLEKILGTVDLRIHEEATYEAILSEFKKNIEEWALSLLPPEVSYNRDGWMGAESPEEASAFNEALEEVRDAILKETR